jgi:hypothetical protein
MTKREKLTLNKGKKMEMTETQAAEAAEAKTTVAQGEVIAEPPKQTADPLLVQILSTKRKHNSKGDRDFRMWLFGYLNSTLKAKPRIVVEGNIIVEVDPKSTVLFSCHVDTVHGAAECDGTLQQLAFDPTFGHLFLADKEKSGCLGADDGCGIYIMLRMIEKGIKGKYIFHTGEEVGGIGSRAFVAQNKKFCEDVEMVVAFDRAVYSGENPEVIITQGGASCASTTFGEALCKELNKTDFDLPYIISHKGSFTDSKVYRDIVPECVNIACFYERQHTPNEYVDVVGLEKLVKAACSVAWDKLPIMRNPLKKSDQESLFDSSNWGGWGSGVAKGKPFANTKIPKDPPKPQIPVFEPELSLLDELSAYSMQDFEEFILEDTGLAQQALMELVLQNKALQAELAAAKRMLGL